MTDYEPFFTDPAERASAPPLARWRPLTAWLAVIVLVLALTAVWALSRDDQDPSLQVPEDRLQLDPASEAPADSPAEEPAA